MLRPRINRILRLTGSARLSTSRPSREFKVILDAEAQTLYIDKPLAEALGWTSDTGPDSVKLNLHGWDPKYFAITPSGSTAEMLARNTAQSGKDPNVQAVLSHLKEYDASHD